MPRYEFLCEEWRKPFELIMTISEREKGDVKCPKCQGDKVVPQFGGFMALDGEEELSVLVTNEAEETDAQDPS
jgi:putative FmdB family regulatory protein